jgi:hypothetical protein
VRQRARVSVSGCARRRASRLFACSFRSLCARRVCNLKAFDGRRKACGHQKFPGGQRSRGERPAQARGRAGGAESGSAGSEQPKSRARGGRQSLQNFAHLRGRGAVAPRQTRQHACVCCRHARARTCGHARGARAPAPSERHAPSWSLQLSAPRFLNVPKNRISQITEHAVFL